jgi:hypothetical protein
VLRLRCHGAPFLLVSLLGTGCARLPSQPAPQVDYAGCAAILSPGPVCVLEPERKLHLWLRVPPNAQLDLRVDGRSFPSTGETVRAGRRLVLGLPAEAKRVEVALAGHAPWVLGIAPPGSKAPAGSRDVLGDVRSQVKALNQPLRAGDLVAYRQGLGRIRLMPSSPAQSRYLVRFAQGQLADREGDYRSAFQELQAALEIADRLDLDRFRWFAEQQLALLWRAVGRSAESARLFERVGRQLPPTVNACERAQALTNQAFSELLAREAGENAGAPDALLEEALRAYDGCSSAQAERKANALINLALADVQQRRMSRTAELLARARGLEPHPPLPHRLWQIDIEGRLALLAGKPTAALRSFGELEDLAAQTASFDGQLRARLGAARAHQSLGESAKALQTLLDAEKLLDEQSLQVPMQEGRDTFVAARQSLVSLHIGLLLDQGRAADALLVARRARARLLRQLAHVDRLSTLPPDQRDRRSRLIGEYQQRRAALEARAEDDWKLPADELRHEEDVRRAEAEAANELLDEAFLVLGEPRDQEPLAQAVSRRGELLLAYQPVGADWVAFAADETGVAARRFELPPDLLARPDSLAALLLVPFRSRIEHAQRVRILASGRLEGVDFHALPFAGDVLGGAKPIVYGLDLGVPSQHSRAAGRRALLVSDPRGDLPGAAAESIAVRRALRSARPPWATEELRAADATADAVERRLAGADLFHYAGHGSFSGPAGWDSSLLLAKETKVTLGDLLALDRLPAWVVLSGCETGRSTTDVPVAGLGLAHAFLLAGSRAVVASTRPTDDRSLPGFFAELYQEWQANPDLAVALQRAQLAWRRRAPEADWASFRLFEP